MPRLSKVGAAALAAFGWTGISSVTASYLIVAGGGGGHANYSGGGGAGGLLTGTTSLNPTQSYSIVVGAGGSGEGGNGSNSTGFSFTAIGGGGGGYTTGAGSSGGSGGGAGNNGGSGGAGTVGQGNNGGAAGGSTTTGGGGGAGAVGGTGNGSNQSGAGGIGSTSSISGTSTYYAGGGGGGGTSSGGVTGGAGGLGGGGAGATTQATAGVAGTANTGGGSGGSSGGAYTPSGKGGSGIVIISYVGAQQFGGGVVTSVGGNTIHTFTTSGTLVPITPLTASALVVAGGGGGSGGNGGTPAAGAGGGGAGGYRTGSGITIDTNSIYLITVGAGGSAGVDDGLGTNGSNSVFNAITSTGGGRGGATSGVNGATGGSGGGGQGKNSGAGGAGNTPSTSPSQGSNGGAGGTSVGGGGGGGGGASAVGTNATSASGGAGGAGTASSLSGSSVTYAGGGGGGNQSSGSGGAGGAGGGGAGGTGGVGTAGTANLGGGGGGAGVINNNQGFAGGNGGSGIVIISYAGATQLMAGGTVTISGGNVIHTFTSTGYLAPIKLVSNSLRFRASASAYLNRTLTTPTNNKIWTWSAWVKRGILGTIAGRTLFRAGVTSPSNGIRFEATTDVLRLFFNDASSGDLVTTQVFRDPAAWYHIIVAVDTTQATAANRAKIYINGTQVTAFSTASYPAQNYDPQINSAVIHTLGAFYASGSPSEFFDGYMTEVNFIDGQALTPFSFGTINSYGVWQPITYGGSYGINGFYLPFSNTASATTLAYDFSPNGNNWTPNNIASITSPATILAFKSSATWTAPAGVSTVNYLVVGGGGGGYIGGGGAGGYRTGTLSVTPGTTYTATVGAGGATNVNGSDSVFSSITSAGGGGGAAGGAANAGGSGGGGSYASGAGAAGNTPSTSPSQGNNGGSGSAPSGGGGGGAGAVGGNASGTTGGAGGNGTTVSATLGGGTYAGGGGGSCGSGTTPGGSGGGGSGSQNNAAIGAGGVNTGGGGGGNQAVTSPAGGSGIVIISYTVDSMTDVPTLTSATAANYCVMNPLDTNTITMSNGNLTANTSGTTWTSARASFGLTSGKWYWEYTINGVPASSQYTMVGVASASVPLSSYIGASATGYGYNANDGQKYNNSTAGAYGSAYTSGDVIGVALDMDAGTLIFYKNNTSQGTAYTGLSGTIFPAVSMYVGSGSMTTGLNFGQQGFVYTPPSGFVALNTFNL